MMNPRITQRVKQCALKLQDQTFIVQLSPGDLVAQEANYHSQGVDVQRINYTIELFAFHANEREPRDLDVTITFLLP